MRNNNNNNKKLSTTLRKGIIFIIWKGWQRRHSGMRAGGGTHLGRGCGPGGEGGYQMVFA